MNYQDLIKKEIIWLDDKELYDEDMGVLVKVVQESEVLEGLLLCSNHITLADGAFTSALAQNHTLRTLNLYNNKIGVEGAKCLAAALKVNSSLQQLHLGGNHIGDKGAQFLADSLVVNKGLSKIWLNRNRIGDNGAHRLANALACNYVPKQIALEENHISCDMKKTIKSIHTFMAKRKRETRRNEIVIARKDKEIRIKDEELASKSEELTSKSEQIASLEAAIRLLKQQQQQCNTRKEKRVVACLDTPDLVSEKAGDGNKRRRVSRSP